MKKHLGRSGWNVISPREADINEEFDDICQRCDDDYWRREIARVLRERQRHIESLRKSAARAKDYADRLQAQLRATALRDDEQERSLFDQLLSIDDWDTREKLANKLGVCMDWYHAAYDDADRSIRQGRLKFNVPITTEERQKLIKDIRIAARYDTILATKLEQQRIEVVIRTGETDHECESGAPQVQSPG